MKFYNRKYELQELERVHKLCNKSTHFTLISGRRRIGKTELVKTFFSNKEHLYFFVGRKKPELLLEEFSSILKTKSPHFPIIKKFDEWFEFLLNNVKPNTVIFFDEFQNFKYVDDSIFSDFQKIFDKYKLKTSIHIIVAGSHRTLMDKIFSDDKEPLFGRATEKYALKPLLFEHISLMLNEININSLEEQIRWYAIFGGMPKYYVVAEEQGLENTDIISALQILLLRDFSPLKEEAKSILIEEFGNEHTSYFSILEAVALGNSEMTVIANKSGIKLKSISKYLSLLVKEFGYLTYAVPITVKKPWKSKKGRYFLTDNFFRFWFLFIYRNMSDYEMGNYEPIIKKIKENLQSFTGKVFEEVSKQYLINLNNNQKSPIQFTKIGPWWHKEKEIDLVALNDESKDILFCECKWKYLTLKQAETIISELKQKAIHVDWNNDDRKEQYCIIAKKIIGKDTLKKQGILAYDLADF